MIREFYVKNFKSIKERVDVSLAASALTEDTFYDNSFSFKGNEILKVSSFYGTNATGKSALVVALAALRELVVINANPLLSANYEYRLPYFPFLFSNETRNAPTEFGIEFSLNNDESSFIYKYIIQYDQTHILKETLYKETSQKFSLVYDRQFIDGVTQIDFGHAFNNPLLNALKPSVMEDRSLLSLFFNFNVPDLTDAYNFFAERMVNVTPEISRFSDYIPQKILTDNKLKEFTLKLLKAADFNIKNLKVDKSKRRAPFVFGRAVPNNDAALFLEHEGDVDDGVLEFIDESLGTKKMILLAEILYPVFSKASVLIVDELESSLHPELTKFVVELFLDETINSNNSQLLFTSHESSLLNLNLLRRDQINFVYKDKDTCGTYIRSLKDFGIRKSENVSKSYLAGRYMTSPNPDGDALRK